MADGWVTEGLTIWLFIESQINVFKIGFSSCIVFDTKRKHENSNMEFGKA